MKIKNLIESKTNEANVFTQMGNKLASMVPGSVGAKATGKLQAGRIVQHLKKQYQQQLGGTGQKADGRSLQDFLAKQGLDLSDVQMGFGPVDVDKAITQAVQKNYNNIMSAGSGATPPGSGAIVSQTPPKEPTAYKQARQLVDKLDSKSRQRLMAYLQKSTAGAPPAAAPSGAMAQMANQLSRSGTSSTGGQTQATPTGVRHTASPNNPNVKKPAPGTPAAKPKVVKGGKQPAMASKENTGNVVVEGYSKFLGRSLI